MRPAALLILFLVTCTVVVAPLFAQTADGPLTNAAVLTMLKDGLSPEIVVAKIQSSTCDFDTSPTSLKNLKT